MKKVILLILVSILLLLAFTSCAKIKSFFGWGKGKDDVTDTQPGDDQSAGCEHVWAEATCQAPKTCTICKVTEGVPSNHKTVPATCTTPQMCEVCGYTSSYWRPALGHNWKEASCMVTDPTEKAKPWADQRGTPKTCRTCGVTEGDAIGHTLVEATCTKPAHCSACSAINPDINDGKALGHNPVPMEEKSATCTEKGSTGGEWCDNCHEIYEDPTVLPALNHTIFERLEFGAVDVTCTTDGVAPGEKCQGCGFVFVDPTPIPATGHRREKYDIDGNVIGEAELKEEKYVDAEGNAVAPCENNGTAYYECTICTERVDVVLPPKDHKYPADASCDGDYTCEYCNKPIEHEYADPTCTDPATCKNCGDKDESRPALNHEGLMAPATCTSPSTCTKCGHTEGDPTSHKVSFGIYRGTVQYSCKTCDSKFSPTSEIYLLDGGSHDNMAPVNNHFTGYITASDTESDPGYHMPVIKTDESGNRYYEFIRDDREPEVNPYDNGNKYSPQAQMWVPMMRNGFKGFNAANSSVGFFSFKINAFMDRGMNMSFAESSNDWKEAIQFFFNISAVMDSDEDIDPEDPDLGKKREIAITGLDGLPLRRIDVTDKTTPNTDSDTNAMRAYDITVAPEEMFTGWFEVCIGIILNENDTFTFHYYIDGEYAGAVSKPLLTSGDGIKCVYISGNTDVAGSGIKLDDICFGYLASGAWPYDTDHVHNFTEEYDRKDATCVSDGYIVYTCTECGIIGNKKVTPALGHDEVIVEAKAATCNEDGYTSYSYCEKCKTEIVKMEVIPGGHIIETDVVIAPTCNSSGVAQQTCTRDGCSYSVTISPPKLNHEYALTADCDAAGAKCIRCNYVNTAKTGHVMAPATCTKPSSCMREGCTYTEGDPIPHTMAPASCTAPSTCTMCNEYTEGSKLNHSLDYKYKDSKVVYFCPTCDASFTLETGYYLNGYNYDGMTGVDNGNFTVKEDTNLPIIVTGTDRYYQLLNTKDEQKQFQLWIPKEDTSSGFGYSSGTDSTGFLSFRINAKIVGEVSKNNRLIVKVVDGSNNQNPGRWTDKSVAAIMQIDYDSNRGQTRLRLGNVSGQEIGDVGFTYYFDMDGEDGFTGWRDIAIGMELDSGGDQITFHCYIDGVYKKSFSQALKVATKSVNCVYFTGWTTGKNTGIMLDDISFGYANKEWVFNQCEHVLSTKGIVHMPTCTEEGYTEWYCTKECGYREITDIVPHLGGHIGGNATCTEQAKCIRKYVNDNGRTVTCNTAYGSTLGGHAGGVPTCEDKGVCTNKYVVITYTDSKGNYTLDENGKPIEIDRTTVECGTEYMSALGHKPDTSKATCANAPEDIKSLALCATCGDSIANSYVACQGGQATCTAQAICQWCNTAYGEVSHKWKNALCDDTIECGECGLVQTSNATHYPVPTLVDGKLAYACKYCGYTLKLTNSFYHTADTTAADAPNLDTLDEKNTFNTSSHSDAVIVTDGDGEDANRYYEFVHDGTAFSDRSLEKATVWAPKSGGTSGGFDTFTLADNMVGVFSVDMNIYVEGVSGVNGFLEMRFVDTDCRSGGTHAGLVSSFWSGGATDAFFRVEAPNANNVVTLKGLNGYQLATIQVAEYDKYTGWFNLTVGMQFDSANKKLVLHYYIDGVYKHTANLNADASKLVTGKIDGVFITATTNVKGSGFKFDNLGFGCVKPNVEGNLPPFKKEEQN